MRINNKQKQLIIETLGLIECFDNNNLVVEDEIKKDWFLKKNKDHNKKCTIAVYIGDDLRLPLSNDFVCEIIAAE